MKKILIIILAIFLCSCLWCKPEFSRTDWEKLSDLEKAITALSDPIYLEEFDIDYSDYTCLHVKGKAYTDAKQILKDIWGIEEKNKLIMTVNNLAKGSYQEGFLEKCKLLDDNPEKTPARIAFEKELSKYHTASLFYIYDMRSKLGSHGMQAFSVCIDLFLLRLGLGAGIITEAEMEEYAAPFVQKALSDYMSLEDYAAHCLATSLEDTLTRSKAVEPIINAWTNTLKFFPIDDIKFSGETADKKGVLTMEQALYEPSEYVRPFIELVKISDEKYEGDKLPVLSECYKKYGALVFTFIKPVVYDPEGTQSAHDFFEKEYRWLWDLLEDYEKIAIACSSNVVERNYQFHLDFTTRIALSRKSNTGEDILNERWEIYDEAGLMKEYEELCQGEQAAVYIKLKNLLLKYPELSVLEIGAKEALSVSEISRMYFVKDKMELLGEHGLEAWIDARRISILRWGIGAGYISQEKAVELVKPIVAQIKQNYTSFAEFIAHWIAGYCFNEIYYSNSPDCAIDLMNAIESAWAYIPFDELVFTGENADKSHCLTIAEAIYTPSAVAQKMIPFQNLYRQDDSMEVLEELIKLEQENPEYKNAMFYYHLHLLLRLSYYPDRIALIEDNLDYINSIPDDSKVYEDAYYVYLNDLLMLFEVEKALSVYEALPEHLRAKPDFVFYYAYGNYLMTKICSTILERDIYISRSASAYKWLQKNEYPIGSLIECWLNALESL